MDKIRAVRSAIASGAMMLGSLSYAPAQQAASPAKPDVAPQQQAGPQVPDEYRLNLMIRNAVIALNQANLTGNYSVLRDLGTPSFQVANNPAKLAEIFAVLRARKLDLTPIMFFNPKLSAQPSLQDGQLLRLTGFFATTPEQVQFDLGFQVFADQWMLAMIAVKTASPSEAAPAAPAAALQSPPSAPKSAGDPQTVAEPRGPGGDTKPVRIDLGEPSPAAPAKKPVKKKKPAAPQPASQAAPPPPAADPAKPAAAGEGEQAPPTRSSALDPWQAQ